ncbi:MAG: hypothetical protein ACQESR_23365 [Planctomycetota bacterium]
MSKRKELCTDSPVGSQSGCAAYETLLEPQGQNPFDHRCERILLVATRDTFRGR